MHIVEIISRAETKFREIDTDASGFIEPAEFAPVIDFMLKTSTDSKERKILTKEECVIKIEGTDKNSDGKLSLEEFIVLYEEVLGVLPRDAAAIPDEATTE